MIASFRWGEMLQGTDTRHDGPLSQGNADGSTKDRSANGTSATGGRPERVTGDLPPFNETICGARIRVLSQPREGGWPRNTAGQWLQRCH